MSKQGKIVVAEIEVGYSHAVSILTRPEGRVLLWSDSMRRADPIKRKRLFSTKLIWKRQVIGIGIYFTRWFIVLQVAKWAIFIGPHLRTVDENKLPEVQ